MNDKISWGKGDIGSKIYGIYENKIQQKLKDISKPILIDIGAADGFFAIGCLKSKICEFCYAFEETKINIKIINVKNKLYKITKNLLIFQKLLFYEMIFLLKKIINIIIEIHKNNKKNLEIELLERSKKFFNISIIIDNNKNFENISELHTLKLIETSFLAKAEVISANGGIYHRSDL